MAIALVVLRLPAVEFITNFNCFLVLTFELKMFFVPLNYSNIIQNQLKYSRIIQNLTLKLLRTIGAFNFSG